VPSAGSRVLTAASDAEGSRLNYGEPSQEAPMEAGGGSAPVGIILGTTTIKQFFHVLHSALSYPTPATFCESWGQEH